MGIREVKFFDKYFELYFSFNVPVEMEGYNLSLVIFIYRASIKEWKAFSRFSGKWMPTLPFLKSFDNNSQIERPVVECVLHRRGSSYCHTEGGLDKLKELLHL